VFVTMAPTIATDIIYDLYVNCWWISLFIVIRIIPHPHSLRRMAASTINPSSIIVLYYALCYCCYRRFYLLLFHYFTFKMLLSYSAIQPQV